MDVAPINEIASQSLIEFSLSSTNFEYLDLSQMFLYVLAKVTKPDFKTGYEVEGKDAVDVGLTNNSLHSLFSSVSLFLNHESVSTSTGENLYPYKAMLLSLLQYDKQGLEDGPAVQGAEFVWDQAGKMDDSDNSGHQARKKWTAKGAGKELFGRLFLDMCHQERLLLPGVDVRLKLARTKPQFVIFYPTAAGTEKPQAIIEKATLYVRKVRIQPEIRLEHERSMASGLPALYPIDQVEC